MNAYLIPVLAAITTATAVFAPASAGDIQGDAYNCKELWFVRNHIYKDNGYCFTSARAIATFGNAGCQHDSMVDVPLSRMDRIVIRDSKRSEARQGC